MVIAAATKNKNKIEEMAAITKAFGMDIISRLEAGVPEDVEIEEDGETFEENSEKKAREIMKICGMPAIADDSGLMVDALDGAPGVMSARFAGEHGDDAANNRRLTELLADVPFEKRTARFVSVITLVFTDGRTISARGECEGHMLLEPRGESGFGYDPLFVPEGYDKTFAELGEGTKNKISHRSIALGRLADLLRTEGF
jgi:XTP/dITP diphosphohydrolase